MALENSLFLLVLISSLSVPLSFWLMTRSLNKATSALMKQNSETTALLNQSVNLLSTKDPIAYQQVLAASGLLTPIHEKAPLVTDNYVEVDEENEFNFDDYRREYGIK